MGGGSQSGSNESRPLTAGERSALYNMGVSSISGTTDNNIFSGTGYQSPDFVSGDNTAGFVNPGESNRFNDGDYDALQQSVFDRSTAGLREFETDERGRIDDSLAKRGLYSSGVAERAQLELSDNLGDSWQRAGAEAVSARYGLQQADNRADEQFRLASSGLENQTNQVNAGLGLQTDSLENQFNVNNASAQSDSAWRPLDYLQGLYNQTGGTISSGSSSGWNFGL